MRQRNVSLMSSTRFHLLRRSQVMIVCYKTPSLRTLFIRERCAASRNAMHVNNFVHDANNYYSDLFSLTITTLIMNYGHEMSLQEQNISQ